MRTLLEVVRLSTVHLGDRGSSSPRLDAELLAAHALGIGRLDLYLQHDRPLAEAELTAIRDLVRRRAGGEPVAYLLGRREFYGRPFVVTPAVLIPRPDTETLVQVVLAWARSVAGAAGEGLRLADLGTGSGCIACTLAAELPGARVVAADISGEALEVARENAVRLGVEDRVSLVRAGWADALAADGGVDAVVSNPPYVSGADLGALDRGVRDFEPRLALDGGADGLEQYAPLIAAAAAALGEGGLLALEVDPRQGDAVVELIRRRLPGSEPVGVEDLSGRRRVIRGVRPGGPPVAPGAMDANIHP